MREPAKVSPSGRDTATTLSGVVFSHPAKQQNVYRFPAGVKAHGIRPTLLTGLYYFANRFPYSIAAHSRAAYAARIRRLLEGRRSTELDEAEVISVSGLLPELADRSGLWKVDTDVHHDRMASRWLAKPANTAGKQIFHGFQNGCLASLQAARDQGLVTAVQLTQPYCWPQIWLSAIQKWQLPYGHAPRFYLRELQEARIADFVIAESDWGAKTLSAYGFPAGKIVKLSYGVDAEVFFPRAKGAAEADICTFICAGQLSVRKGLHLLIAAWAELNLPRARLLLVGTPSDELGRTMVDRLPASVKWLPFMRHADLAEAYREADVCVVPSISESGCMVAYEAAASGLACIVSDRAGSLIRDGVEGLVVKAGSVSALSAALLQLYRDVRQRQAMGEAARQRACHFTWSDFGRRLVEAYRLMLSRKAEGRGVAQEPAIDVFEL